MNLRQAPVICQLFLVCLIGLQGCAETKNWTLSYTATSEAVPDLVLVFRVDGTGESASLKANFNTSSDDVNFQPAQLKILLESCADELSAASKPDCVELADHIGSVLFRGVPKVFVPGDSPANRSVSIAVSATTSRFFLLFLYRMGEDISVSDDRCMVLKAADRTPTGFTVEGGSGKNLSIEVERGEVAGQPENRGCFPLGI